LNLREAVDYTQQLVRYSSANYIKVLTARQNLLAVHDCRERLGTWSFPRIGYLNYAFAIVKCGPYYFVTTSLFVNNSLPELILTG